MLNWMLKNKYSLIVGFIMTYFAVKYSYQKRGSLEFGSEYIFLFLPVINSKLLEVGRFTIAVCIELIDEIKMMVLRGEENRRVRAINRLESNNR